tara:strand:+ start:421 stop:804 length:384 start_codon:yes stop_codon:yes gene_type:complete
MIDIVLVACGAILGANSRFLIFNKLKNQKISKDYLILIINTFASFCLGLFLSILTQVSSLSISNQLVLFFSIGFLGSLSTFSSFIYDLFNLLLQFNFVRALKISSLSISLGFMALAFGLSLGSQMNG